MLTLIMAMSVNGKISRKGKSNWTSPEDIEEFKKFLGDFDGVVLGRKTFEEIFSGQRFPRPYFVLTQNKNFSAMPEKNVFVLQEQPSEKILEIFENAGLHKMVLLGGEMANAFFADVIDEIFLTIEPVLFGEGKGLFSEKPFEKNLSLVKIKQLNAAGTLLLHYKVLKNV